MSKKVVKQFMDLGDKIEVKINKGNLDNPIGEFEFLVKGEFKDMSNSVTLKSLQKLMLDGFEKVNSRLDNIETRLENVETRLENVETRLDVVETDIKDIKSCPTIQQELKNKK